MFHHLAVFYLTLVVSVSLLFFLPSKVLAQDFDYFEGETISDAEDWDANSVVNIHGTCYLYTDQTVASGVTVNFIADDPPYIPAWVLHKLLYFQGNENAPIVITHSTKGAGAGIITGSNGMLLADWTIFEKGGKWIDQTNHIGGACVSSIDGGEIGLWDCTIQNSDNHGIDITGDDGATVDLFSLYH